MKTNLLSKSFIAISIAAAVAGCSDDGGASPATRDASTNTAPTHGGNIVVPVNEKDSASFVYLLGATNGQEIQAGVAASESGVAFDADADVLSVTDLTIAIDGVATDIASHDSISYDQIFRRVQVDPSFLIDDVDTGETAEIVFSYSVTDGLAIIARTATVAVAGEDFAPEFDGNLTGVLSKFDDSTSFDLLEGATDADGESLSVSNVVFDTNAPDGLLSFENGELTVDPSIVADGIVIGDSESYTVDYTVDDHRFNVARQITVEIRGVRLEPVAPIITGTQQFDVSTSSGRASFDLTSEPVVLDENGDDLSIDLDSIAPVGDAPDLAFAASSSDNLVVDVMQFAQWVAPGATETFSYTYDVIDPSDLIGPTQATVDINVTNDGNENILSNGGFESGLTGWTQLTSGIATIETVSTNGLLDIEGTQFVRFASDETLSADLTGLDTDTNYVAEFRVNAAGNQWGGTPLLSVDNAAGDAIENARLFPHGVALRTYAIPFSGADGATLNFKSSQLAELDDVRVYRNTFDQAINIISEDDSTFDNGIGNWQTTPGTVTTDSTKVIAGAGSLDASTTQDPRHILDLGTGTLKKDRRYLLTLDVNASAITKFRASVVDAEAIDSTMRGGAFTGIVETVVGQQTMAFVLDPSRDSSAVDWDTRPQQLHLGTNVWAGGPDIIIDNVRLVAIP